MAKMAIFSGHLSVAFCCFKNELFLIKKYMLKSCYKLFKLVLIY